MLSRHKDIVLHTNDLGFYFEAVQLSRNTCKNKVTLSVTNVKNALFLCHTCKNEIILSFILVKNLKKLSVTIVNNKQY